jgi:hypothetical protein
MLMPGTYTPSPHNPPPTSGLFERV